MITNDIKQLTRSKECPQRQRKESVEAPLIGVAPYCKNYSGKQKEATSASKPTVLRNKNRHGRTKGKPGAGK